MPGPNRTIKHTYRPGLLLQVAIVAWMGVVVTPCAVFAADAPTAALATPVDCHGALAEGQVSDAECCCDPLATTGGEAPKSQRVDLVAAPPPASSLIPVLASAHSSEHVHPPPQSDSHHPVYLSTQRLRI